MAGRPPKYSSPTLDSLVAARQSISRPPPTDIDPGATDGTFEDYLLTRLFSHLHQADEALVEAIATGEQVPARLTSFAELTKQLSTARERWLVIRERQRRLVDLDEVMAAIGPELAEARRKFMGMGKRLAPELDGTLAERAEVIDREVDAALRLIEAAIAAGTKTFEAVEDLGMND